MFLIVLLIVFCCRIW